MILTELESYVKSDRECLGQRVGLAESPASDSDKFRVGCFRELGEREQILP